MHSFHKFIKARRQEGKKVSNQPKGFVKIILSLLGFLLFFPFILPGRPAGFSAPDPPVLNSFDPAPVAKAEAPPANKKLPEIIKIGGFDLNVVSYDEEKGPKKKKDVFSKLSGIAEVSIGCLDYGSLEAVGVGANIHYFKIVKEVKRPEREIALIDALKIDKSARLNQKIPLRLEARLKDNDKIILAKESLLAKLKEAGGGIRVRFEDVSFEIRTRAGVAIARTGRAFFPADETTTTKVPPRLSIDGFFLHLSSLSITTEGAVASGRLQLPQTLFDAGNCGPAYIDLEEVSISPDCKFYVEMAAHPFGPFAVGNTGMVIGGTGFRADFRTTAEVTLLEGSTIGEQAGTVYSNTGYLKGKFEFTDAQVISSGLSAQFDLAAPYSFNAVNPIGYTVSFVAGQLFLKDSRITGGQIGSGNIILPTAAICIAGFPGTAVSADFTLLEVQEDLDLGGEVQFGTGAWIGWGELTRAGSENIVWGAAVRSGLFYLPSGPVQTASPDLGGGFLGLLSANLQQLENAKMAGVTILGMDTIEIRTPDLLGQGSWSITNNIRSWLRVGSTGLDGETFMYELDQRLYMGNNMRTGYVANYPFSAAVKSSGNKYSMHIRYVASAVFDSGIDGFIDLPPPCGFDSLVFSDMELTSTANLVGGDIELPVDGLTLEYWQLPFVPTGDPTQAGVVSVRTGRLVFTAAGISEPVHFEKPFRLTWGEILADGNFNELFIDYNNYGQKFDDIPYNPENMVLSRFIPTLTGGYLATCGTLHFNFFGGAYVNIQDARNDARPDAPFFGRSARVPKTGETACEPTNLHLQGSWEDGNGDWLTILDFPGDSMKYNSAIQYGFIGAGEGQLVFIGGDELRAVIEIHGTDIDICLTSNDTHDLNLGLFAILGGISQTMGCLRITGPQLQRISVQGYLEMSTSTGFGILEPKTGYYAEVLLSATPNILTFSTSGDLFVAVAGTAVDVSGTIFLKKDYLKQSAEGEITGRIDCNAAIAGLTGEGQVTWYADPVSQYFQGKVKIKICSWAGSGGLEGGIFIGKNVAKSKAWVLYAGSDRFGIEQDLLPESLTGIFGYGQLASSIQWYVFGGGFELYVGLGAFSEIPSDAEPALELTGVGLPYVVGSGGVYVHGEILGGLVSAAAWGDLDLVLGLGGFYFEGSFGLEGCILWVICASVEVRAGYGRNGFYIYSN